MASRRTRRTTATPSRSGRPRSSTTRSGRAASQRASARAASSTSSTGWPWRRRKAATVERRSGSSSTRRTDAPSERAGSRVIRSCPVGPASGVTSAGGSATGSRTVDRQAAEGAPPRLHVAAHRLDQATYDRQPDAGPTPRPLPRPGDAVELLEQPGQRLVRHARAVVLDRQSDPVAGRRLRRDPDAALGRRVLGRRSRARLVITWSTYTSSTATGGRSSGTSTSRVRGASAGAADRRWPRPGRPGRGAAARLEPTGLDAAHVEQVGHEAIEPVRLLVDGRRRRPRVPCLPLDRGPSGSRPRLGSRRAASAGRATPNSSRALLSASLRRATSASVAWAASRSRVMAPASWSAAAASRRVCGRVGSPRSRDFDPHTEPRTSGPASIRTR